MFPILLSIKTVIVAIGKNISIMLNGGNPNNGSSINEIKASFLFFNITNKTIKVIMSHISLTIGIHAIKKSIKSRIIAMPSFILAVIDFIVLMNLFSFFSLPTISTFTFLASIYYD